MVKQILPISQVRNQGPKSLYNLPIITLLVRDAGTQALDPKTLPIIVVLCSLLCRNSKDVLSPAPSMEQRHADA